MQKMQSFRRFMAALFLPVLLGLPGCRPAPKNTLQIRDETGAVVATFSGVNVAPSGKDSYAVAVKDGDKGALESVSKAHLGKTLIVELTGFPAQAMKLMTPLSEGTFRFGVGNEAHSVGELLKTFEPPK